MVLVRHGVAVRCQLHTRSQISAGGGARQHGGEQQSCHGCERRWHAAVTGLRRYRATAAHRGPATRAAAPELAPVDYLGLDVDGRGVDQLRSANYLSLDVEERDVDELRSVDYLRLNVEERDIDELRSVDWKATQRFRDYSRSPKNPALQLLQKMSKSASAGS